MLVYSNSMEKVSLYLPHLQLWLRSLDKAWSLYPTKVSVPILSSAMYVCHVSLTLFLSMVCRDENTEEE